MIVLIIHCVPVKGKAVLLIQKSNKLKSTNSLIQKHVSAVNLPGRRDEYVGRQASCCPQGDHGMCLLQVICPVRAITLIRNEHHVTGLSKRDTV